VTTVVCMSEGIHPRSRQGVQSVERALKLIEETVGSEQGLTLKALAALAGLPGATTHRLAQTLIARGYLRLDQAKKLRPGSRLFQIGAEAGRQMLTLARPFLRRLVEASGETANLAVLEEPFAVYVAQVPSESSVRMFVEVGRRVDTSTTAVGKVLLAHHPRQVVERILAGTELARWTPQSITDRNAFLLELERVASQGYAIDNEEHELGVRCVSVPVSGAFGETVSAISVSGPASRMTLARCAEIVPVLQEVARDMSADSDAPGPLKAI
jgi:IclR family acetate operon transcriptional repressor